MGISFKVACTYVPLAWHKVITYVEDNGQLTRLEHLRYVGDDMREDGLTPQGVGQSVQTSLPSNSIAVTERGVSAGNTL